MVFVPVTSVNIQWIMRMRRNITLKRRLESLYLLYFL